MTDQILIVDDDALLRKSLAYNLEKAGYQVSSAATAEEALEQVSRSSPSLVLLDIGLPGIDGLEALRRLRQRLNLPVIFVTARRRELDQVVGLELGADDYVTKPFDIDVLVARIRAVLRRTRATGERTRAPILTVGALTIDQDAHTVTANGREVSLTPREFDVIWVLAENAGRVISIDELLERVWGQEYVGEPQAVYVYIRWLREKLERDPQSPERILTVRGVGYRLVAPEGEEQAPALQ